MYLDTWRDQVALPQKKYSSGANDAFFWVLHNIADFLKYWDSLL